jgi:hypothetical protein
MSVIKCEWQEYTSCVCNLIYKSIFDTVYIYAVNYFVIKNGGGLYVGN